jgi:RNA polymerase sigma factor (sigma-70 family)
LDCLLQKERISSLQNALDSLDPVDLEILNLKYAHNWSYAQLGHHLGLGFNQIANRLREARRRLKSALLRSPFAQELLEVERRDPA